MKSMWIELTNNVLVYAREDYCSFATKTNARFPGMTVIILFFISYCKKILGSDLKHGNNYKLLPNNRTWHMKNYETMSKSRNHPSYPKMEKTFSPYIFNI